MMKSVTSAIEQLEHECASYMLHEYPSEGGPVASKDVAAYFGFAAELVYKTLVMSDGEEGYYVFCLPSNKRIDIKKASALVGVHNVQMLDPDTFEKLTGYTRGGCSPFGQRTKLPIYLDVDAQYQSTIYFNGGKIGYLIEVRPELLVELLSAQYADFAKY